MTNALSKVTRIPAIYGTGKRIGYPNLRYTLFGGCKMDAETIQLQRRFLQRAYCLCILVLRYLYIYIYKSLWNRQFWSVVAGFLDPVACNAVFKTRRPVLSRKIQK